MPYPNMVTEDPLAQWRKRQELNLYAPGPQTPPPQDDPYAPIQAHPVPQGGPPAMMQDNVYAPAPPPDPRAMPAGMPGGSGMPSGPNGPVSTPRLGPVGSQGVGPLPQNGPPQRPAILGGENDGPPQAAPTPVGQAGSGAPPQAQGVDDFPQSPQMMPYPDAPRLPRVEIFRGSRQAALDEYNAQARSIAAWNEGRQRQHQNDLEAYKLKHWKDFQPQSDHNLTLDNLLYDAVKAGDQPKVEALMKMIERTKQAGIRPATPDNSKTVEEEIIAAHKAGDEAGVAYWTKMAKTLKPPTASGGGSPTQDAPEIFTNERGERFIRSVNGKGWTALAAPMQDVRHPTAAQSEGMVQLDQAISSAGDALSAIDAVDGGKPASGAIGETVDTLKQRGSNIAYAAGVSTDRSDMIQKVALLKAMRTGGLLKGVRNQKYIDQIWSHMPDERHDSTKMMRDKLTYITEKLNQLKEEEKTAATNPGALTGGTSVTMAPSGNKKFNWTPDGLVPK